VSEAASLDFTARDAAGSSPVAASAEPPVAAVPAPAGPSGATAPAGGPASTDTATPAAPAADQGGAVLLAAISLSLLLAGLVLVLARRLARRSA
jgi:hypothetical protein